MSVEGDFSPPAVPRLSTLPGSLLNSGEQRYIKAISSSSSKSGTTFPLAMFLLTLEWSYRFYSVPAKSAPALLLSMFLPTLGMHSHGASPFFSVPASLVVFQHVALFLPLWDRLTFLLRSYYSQRASSCCSVPITPRVPHLFALFLSLPRRLTFLLCSCQSGVPHLFALFLPVWGCLTCLLCSFQSGGCITFLLC